MAAMQRTKGASGERELAGLLREHLGLAITRKLDQARGGGYDLEGMPGIALEVKRYQGTTESELRAWWDQAEKQALASGRVPVLAYRLDRKPWRFVVPLQAISGDYPWPGYGFAATIGLEAFCAVMREKMGGGQNP